MQEIVEITRENVRSVSDAMQALEKAATLHAIDLQIDFPRMREEFGALWMIARAQLCLRRFPQGALRVKTWLRSTKAAVSYRDFSLFDGGEEIGRAVQSWILVDALTRKMVNLHTVPPLQSLPVILPERTNVLKRLPVRPLVRVGTFTIGADECDLNGHLNNVHYVRHAEKYAPEGALCMDISYEHECFVGDTLTIYAEDGFVHGEKPDGSTAFRAHFYNGGDV